MTSFHDTSTTVPIIYVLDVFSGYFNIRQHPFFTGILFASARYVQDVATVSQNVRDMQRALLDLALLTEAAVGRAPLQTCGFERNVGVS